jgi:Na+/proline symporter
MFWFSMLLVVVNILFLLLGALLYIYVAEADSVDLPVRIVNGDVKIATDLVYPTIALNYLPPIVGIFFILGIIASTYASSDSALAALTTAFCIDFLNFEKRELSGENTVRIRHIVHIGFSLLLFLIVLLFWFWNDQTVIYLVLRLAGFTYGPLLGLFAFGLLTKRSVRDKLVPIVCLLSPVLTYLIDLNSKTLFNGYVFSYELLLVNGLITFVGLGLLSIGKEKNGING